MSPDAKPANPVEALLHSINQSGRLRVWSLIITIFGDCIAPRGGEISLSSLQSILDLLGIEPNAVRTALSRLAKDDWLKRYRQGRQSSYRLVGEGNELFEMAAKRIYAAKPSIWQGEFDVVLLMNTDTSERNRLRKNLFESGFGSPLAGVFIRPAGQGLQIGEHEGIVRFTATVENMESLKELVATTWSDNSLNEAYHDFIQRFQPLLNSPDLLADMSPGDSLKLRILLVHDWRRIVLKDVELPDKLRGKNWPGNEAKILTARLYRALLDNSEAYLDSLYANADEKLAKSGNSVKNRFAD